MHFDEFKRLALTTLLGHQLDNGSWLNDPIATIAAVEAFCEECGGPDPVCRFSGQHAAIHPDSGQSDWLFPFSWGLNTNPDDPNAAYIAAVFRALEFGGSELWRLSDAPMDQAHTWIFAKWLRINVLVDADAQLYIPGKETLASVTTEEPWLLAQVGHAKLHSNWYFALIGGQDLRERPDIVSLVRRLISLRHSDHWESQSITPEETTGLVGAFLFHECTEFVCSTVDIIEELPRVRERALAWLLDRQSASGGWTESPHVTAHCLKLVDSSLLSPTLDHHDSSACLAALERGVDHLLGTETQPRWISLATYQQIDILATLIRLSKRPRVAETIFGTKDIEGHAFRPDVFVSYGGPDVAFAKRIAKDLEASGIRVWFAEWDLDYGDDVVQEIESGLEHTRKFIVVLSPEAVQRPWVRKELSAAFQQALSGPGKLIVPLMYRQCQPPPFLTAHRWMDFTQDNQYLDQVTELARRLKGRRPSRT